MWAALAVLDRFGLSHLANVLPEAISGGQAQRVSLGGATMTNPLRFLQTSQQNHVLGIGHDLRDIRVQSEML